MPPSLELAHPLTTDLFDRSLQSDIRIFINQLHVLAFHPDRVAKLIHAVGYAERVFPDFPFVRYFLAHTDALDRAIRFVAVAEMDAVAEHFAGESRMDLLSGEFSEALIGRPLRLSKRRKSYKDKNKHARLHC